jgi:hypothetical protein
MLAAVYTAIRTELAGASAVTSLIASRPPGFGGGPAIYGEGDAPNSAPDPYLTVGAGTQVPFDTFGTAGANCTVQIKAIGKVPEQQLLTVVAAVGQTLARGKALTVTGAASAWCDEFQVFPSLVEVVAGVVVRSCPVILRVYAT